MRLHGGPRHVFRLDHVAGVQAARIGQDLGGRSGALQVTVPGLLHEFQIGVPGQPPSTVARVAFIGNLAAMRGYGRLVRDSANGAANAAERAA